MRRSTTKSVTIPTKTNTLQDGHRPTHLQRIEQRHVFLEAPPPITLARGELAF
jgi:hypothetical protein